MPPLRPTGRHALKLLRPVWDSDEDSRQQKDEAGFKRERSGYGYFKSGGEERPPRIPKQEQDDVLAYEKQKRRDNFKHQQFAESALHRSSQPRTHASGSLMHTSERVGLEPRSAHFHDKTTRTSEKHVRPAAGNGVILSAETGRKLDAPQHFSAIPRTALQPATRAHELGEKKQITALTQADLEKTVANLEAEVENQKQRKDLLKEGTEVLRQQLVLRDRQCRGLEETITDLREGLSYFKSSARLFVEKVTGLESQIKNHDTLSKEAQLREDGLKQQISYMEQENRRAERERESDRRATDNLVAKQERHIAELEELLHTSKNNSTTLSTNVHRNHQSGPNITIPVETPQVLVRSRILSEAVFMPDKDNTERVLSVLTLRATTFEFLVEALGTIVNTAASSQRAERWMVGNRCSEGYCLNGALKRHQRSTYNKGANVACSNCTTSGRLCISRDAYSGKLIMRKSQNANGSYEDQEY